MKILPPTIVFLLLFTACIYPKTFTCTRVIDGDTIVLNNGEKVRLIGVDTPDTKDSRKTVQYYGKESFGFTQQMVEGKEVRLEFEQQQRDKYGRLLAYVYLSDSTFLNAEIIKQGYGHAYTVFPFKHLDQFIQHEKLAKENKIGLWANASAEQERKFIRERYVASKKSNKYHLPNCRNGKRIKPSDLREFNSAEEAVIAGYVPCKRCKPPSLKP